MYLLCCGLFLFCNDNDFLPWQSQKNPLEHCYFGLKTLYFVLSVV